MAFINFTSTNAHIISDIKQTCIQIISIDVLTMFLKHFLTKLANRWPLKKEFTIWGTYINLQIFLTMYELSKKEFNKKIRILKGYFRLGDWPAGLSNFSRRVRSSPHPPQGLEIGEKLLWKYDERPLKRRCHERVYIQIFHCS